MTNPSVELYYGNTALDLSTQQILGRTREEQTPEQALSNALLSFRNFAVNQARQELMHLAVVDVMTLNKVMDTIWQLYLPSFGKLTLPYIARSYREGFQKAQAGDVPQEYLDRLAVDYARRVGEYYNATSKEGLIQGFSTYVNRRMGTKQALAKSLQAYGLSSRQMTAVTGITEDKVNSGILSSVRSKTQNYISNALRQRLDVISRQEGHNLEQQAMQAAWLWLHEKDRLPDTAVKVWITAKDERVCPLCGPLHGVRVPLLERFELKSGSLWVPGVHPNCRCEVRLINITIQKDLLGDVLAEFNEEHPRDESGRFSAKQRSRDILQQRAAQRRTVFRPVGYADRPVGNVIEPVVEAVAPTPEVNLSGVTQTNLSGGTNLSQSKTNLSETSLNVEAAAPDLSTQADLSRVTSLNTFLDNRAAQLTMEREEANLTRVKLPTKGPRPVAVAHKNVEDLPTSVYMPLGPNDTLTMSNQYQFNGGRFYTDRERALRNAEMLRQNAMVDAYNKITSYGALDEIRVKSYDPAQNTWFYSYVTPSDVDAAIQYQAAYDADMANYGDDWLELEFFDIDNTFMARRKVSLHELAKDLELDNGDFSVSVAHLEQVHQGNRGTAQHFSGTKSGDEEWVIDGAYEGVAEEMAQDEGDDLGYNIPIITMTPFDPEIRMIYGLDD